MKPLGVYAFISLLFVGVVGAFFAPTQAFAQGIDRQTTSGVITDKTDLNLKGLGVLQVEIDRIKAKQNDPAVAQKYGGATTPAFLLYISESSKLIDKLEANKPFFTSFYNQALAKNATPDAAYTAALTQVNNQFTINSTEARSKSDEANVDLRSITTNIRLAAVEKIDIGRYSDNPAVVENAKATALGANQVQKDILKSDCTISGWDLFACLDKGVAWLIKNIFLEFAGVFLWLTANMLNYAIQIGILNFSQWAPEALYPIWVIVRQIVSLAIVFIGLYLGFMYILGKEDKFEKYIPWVIIFALFVNFSYPLARTAVDISNIVSLNVYSSAVGNDALTADLGSPNTAGSLVMSRLGLNGLILSATKTNDTSAGILKNINSTPASLLAVIFVMYAAYIFFMVTMLIVVRTVSLVFLTIASPILFVDSVLPVLGDRAQQIRKIFFEQLAVGPIFMVMFALTLKFLEVFSSGPMKNVGAGGDATIKTFFNILMMLIMLHIMLRVTKSVAGEIGTYGTNFMGKVGGFGLGVASGGAGLLARGTLGRAALAARQSKWVTNNQDSFLGRRAYDMSNSLAKSTFDLRNSKVVAGKMDKIGLGMGMGRKVGYEAAREAKIQDGTARGERTGTYQENIYDKNTGALLHKKGDQDLSEEAEQARKDYKESGGNSVFTTKFEKNEIRNNVVEADKNRFQTKQDKAISEYGKFEDDPESQQKKKEFFAKQDAETQAKLMKYDAKVEKEKAEKDKEKIEKKEAQSTNLETNKDLAASVKALNETMKGQQNSNSSQFSSKPSSGFSGGETASPSGIILPQTMATPSSMRAPETPHTTVNQQATTQQSSQDTRATRQQEATSAVRKEMGEAKVQDVHNENFAAKAAANRAKFANNAAKAQAEMAKNTPPPEAPSASQVTTPATPPKAPSSAGQTAETV